MIYTVNNCIRAFGYTNFDRLVEDMGSVDNLKAYVIANGYADIAVAEDTELLLVDVNGKTWHTGCYGAVIEPEVEPDYLCFTSTGDSTVAMTQNGTPNTSAGKVIQYKLNDGQWQTWDLSAVTLHDGDKMYLKSDDEIPVSETSDIYKRFIMSGSIAASGNIMSLLNFSDTLTPYVFYRLFQECVSLTTAPALPATTLAAACYDHMFYWCKSLTTTPELPATTLAESCYDNMFTWCASLTTTPELPATTLAKSCYSFMFAWCASLTTAPELPATTLAESCYIGMFYGCTSLVNAPALPASTLAVACYQSMFDNCTSLTQAPKLPATTLSVTCYNSMFSGCTALTTAPALPALILKYSCYSGMFKGCTSLTTGPELPAKELADWCYSNMFDGCTKLNYVKALFTQLYNDEGPSDWLNNVSSTGTFVKSKDATWTNDEVGIPSGWTVQVEGSVTPEPEPERDYLCFTSTGDSTVAMTQNGTPDTSAGKVIQYKLNDGQWQTWDLSAISLTDGDKMYLKSDDEIPVSEPSDIYKNFIMTGSIAASGNIMSLLNFSDTLTPYVFYRLFELCASLTTTPELPATTLAAGCYAYMFYWCESLTTAPALPATTLAKSCYTYMFAWCESLTTTPELPATTLAEFCYQSMFIGCKSLTTAPELPATTLAESCYRAMFQLCTSLTTGPELPAKELAESCYDYMFNGCTALTTAPALPALILKYGCYNAMFKGCTSLTTGPELPAKELINWCYASMFEGCTKLNYVKALFTQLYNDEAPSDWLNNVSSTGTFVKSKDATWTNDKAGIPTGWTVQTASPDK